MLIAQWGDFKSHHQSTRPIDVVAIETDTDVAISFTHSQYVTHHIPIGFIAALHHQTGWYVTPAASLHGKPALCVAPPLR